MTEFCSLYITTKEKWQAKHIARALLEDRLIACANIFEACSIYRWEGQIQDEKEIILIAKTKRELCDSVVEKVKTLHEYECPCIVFHPIIEGSKEYLDWLKKELKA